MAYDSVGKLSSVTDTQSRALSAAYDASNRLSALTDPTARKWTYAYDTAGDLSTYTNPAQQATKFAYDSAHNLTQLTDPRGNITKISYDASRRVTQIVRLSSPTATTGPTTKFAYGTGSMACPTGTTSTAVTEPRGFITTYCWDGERRVVKVRDALNHDRDSTYDSDSNVTQLADGSSVSKAAFLEGGRLSNAQSPTGATRSFLYESQTGQSHTFFPTQLTNPQGKRTALTWSANNLTRVTDGQQGQTVFTYNADGTLASSTSPKGVGLTDPNPYRTLYSYDSNGNLTKVDYPTLLGDELYTYDPLSRVSKRTDGKGQQTTYTYDALDRVTKVTFQDATSVSYSYDGNGNRTSRTGATGTTSYTYDALNRLTKETFPDTSSNSYSYDDAGNLTAFTDGGGTVSYAYDQVGNMTALTEPTGAKTTFGYDVRDNRTSTTFPGSVTISRAFDASDRITEVRALKSGATTPIAHFTYSYAYRDANGVLQDGDLRQRVEDRKAGTATAYAYDGLDRLLEAHRTLLSTGATQDRWTYAWDANSNRTSETRNGTTVSSSFNAANQLTSRGATTYSYDLAGNLTSSTDGLSLGYNAKNQTASAKAPGTTYTETWTWHGADQWERAKATGHPDGDFTYRNSALGASGLAGTSGHDSRYTRDDEGGLISFRQAGGNEYYIQDALGSVVAMTDGAGNVTRSYTYDPFGNTLSSTGLHQPWRFAGAYVDTAGLYKMGHRFYDPKTGRWAQRDSIDHPSDPRQSNRYSYAGGNPVSFTDVTGQGLEFDEIVDDVGQAVAELASRATECDVVVTGLTLAGATVGPEGAAMGVAAGVTYCAIRTVNQLNEVSRDARD